MLTETQRKLLEKQQYRFVGEHSAVKICNWTKKFIRGEGGCYKYTFYGIRSHQCLQMTTSMFCANRCVFCWRDLKALVSKDWYGSIDKPAFIINNAIKEHLLLLKGMKGNKKVNPKMFKEWENIRHVALSLTGEPITYPLLNELLEEFHKKKISTFLVTNGQYPEQLEKIRCLTQLYISVDAPNKELLKKIDLPLFKDYYERLIKCLKIMAEKKFRTCIRLTIIKGLNDFELEGYKKLIEIGKPDFIEVKAYMHLGASRQRLEYSRMPTHSYIKDFSEELHKYLPDYEIADEHELSRVVILIKKSSKNYRFIDFRRFFELANKNGNASIEKYGAVKMMSNQ